MNAVFGNWGGAPAGDAPAIAVPIGSDCSMCKTPFEPGDVGMRMGHVGIDPESATTADAHRECLFLNKWGHLVGICRCTGHDESRESAFLAWARRHQLWEEEE